jgi:hypothetical protein
MILQKKLHCQNQLIGRSPEEDQNKEDNQLKIYLFIYVVTLIIVILLFSNSEGFVQSETIKSSGFMNSIGTFASLVGILLAVGIFYLSEKAQREIRRLSQEMHSLSIMAYKNQSLQLLLDNHLKSPRDTKERRYWHYRFSFENYDTLRLKVLNDNNDKIDEFIKVKIIGTNIAPFQSPAENIITYLYAVEVMDSVGNLIPLGPAYCSFIDGRNKISLSCNQLDLIDPMYEFEIIGPDILHSTWVGDMPKFFSRLKSIKQFKLKDCS